jgi:hypothetical protein
MRELAIFAWVTLANPDSIPCSQTQSIAVNTAAIREVSWQSPRANAKENFCAMVWEEIVERIPCRACSLVGPLQGLERAVEF